jgi:nucleoid-associated protein YgaU
MLYIVETGDTLFKIAEKLYGDRICWKVIYNANPEVIVLVPGVKLIVPQYCDYRYIISNLTANNRLQFG